MTEITSDFDKSNSSLDGKAIGFRKKWVIYYLISLLVVFFWGVLITQFFPEVEEFKEVAYYLPYEVFSSGWAARLPYRMFLEPWHRWDTIWYLKIAKFWYSTGGVELAFPPVYPLLIRLIGKILGGQYLLSSLLISWLSLFGACYLLDERIEQNNEIQNKTNPLIRMLFFPTAIFFFAGYTESLFLFLVLLAWRYADRHQWFWVGLLGSIAVLTRFVGIVLILPFGYMWWKSPSRQKISIKIFSLLFIPLAYFSWVGFTKMNYHLTPSMALNKGWLLHFDWPWVGIIGNIQNILSAPILLTLYNIFDLVAVFIAMGSILFWVKKRAWPEILFLGSVLLISLMKVDASDLLVSTSRYVLPLFPIYLARPAFLQKPLYNRIYLYSSMTLWLSIATLIFIWVWVA